MNLDLQAAVLHNRQVLGSELRSGSPSFELNLARLVAAWQAANEMPIVDGKWNEAVATTLDQTFLL